MPKDMALPPVLWEYGSHMAQGDEKELVRLARAGDARAFRDLLDIHYATVFRMAFHLCGHRENAEDITQMACLKIAQNITAFESKSRFTTWIYTIVLNTFRDWTASRANTGKGFRDIEDMGESLAGHSDPERDAQVGEQMRALSALPDAEREAVILVFAQDCSHKEAAEILGCAESTISWRIHEARKKLSAAGGL